MKFKIDNSWYDLMGNEWWNEEKGYTASLHWINDFRISYIIRVLKDIKGLKLLDVGCGGGILSEGLAKSGADITGIDISKNSISVAKRHAESNGLKIDYFVCSADELIFKDKSFGAALCFEALEHFENMERCISEISRILKPGGFFIYDFIDRTILSKIILKFLFEDVFKTLPKDAHSYEMFIKPFELIGIMKKNNMNIIENKRIGVNMIEGIKFLLKFILKDKINNKKIRLSFNPPLAFSYIGYGVKII